MSLAAILQSSNVSSHSLVIFQSSTAQSSLPILNALLKKTQNNVIICNFLYPLGLLIGSIEDRIRAVDCTADVPGYNDESTDSTKRIFATIRSVSVTQALTVVVDSLDTLLANLASKAAVYAFLGELQSALRVHPNSRLIVHANTPSALPLISYLATPVFSPSLAHIIAYPPVLLTNLATSLSTPPPPISSPEKFWNVFLPIASRTFDVEDLIFGNNGEGGSNEEIVVEVVLRGADATEGPLRRKKGVERTLEGWNVSRELACELPDLISLRSLFTGKPALVETAPNPDPTQNLSFNLALTPEQQQSRTQVPLPYAHTGTLPSSSQQTAAIFYDPDSADDIDDDDPDEDLDI